LIFAGLIALMVCFFAAVDAYFFHIVWQGFKTGQINYRSSTYSRDKDWFSFWFKMFVFLLPAVVIFLGLIAISVSWLAGPLK